MTEKQIIDWLLRGDVSIQCQVYRDLLGNDRKDIQDRIAGEGWGKRFLSRRNPDGHWGIRFYQPKWTSTHYTLLDLRYLNLHPENEIVGASIELILNAGKSGDGGIPLGPSTLKHSDVCVNGMFLNYASYFRTDEQKLYSVVDVILNEIMPDGGFNCITQREGARHSSLHSTISVLEGLHEFQRSGHTYRVDDIRGAKKSAEEFILMHRLFRSDRTGDIINRDFTRLTYPSRWRYDILRALDYFRSTGRKWDERMTDAVDVILSKRNRKGTWNMQAAYPGKVHFVMEEAGAPSRWNTLRVARVLKHFKIE
jgi:hypothetical protein